MKWCIRRSNRSILEGGYTANVLFLKRKLGVHSHNHMMAGSIRDAKSSKTIEPSHFPNEIQGEAGGQENDSSESVSKRGNSFIKISRGFVCSDRFDIFLKVCTYFFSL